MKPDSEVLSGQEKINFISHIERALPLAIAFLVDASGKNARTRISLGRGNHAFLFPRNQWQMLELYVGITNTDDLDRDDFYPSKAYIFSPAALFEKKQPWETFNQYAPYYFYAPSFSQTEEPHLIALSSEISQGIVRSDFPRENKNISQYTHFRVSLSRDLQEIMIDCTHETGMVIQSAFLDKQKGLEELQNFHREIGLPRRRIEKDPKKNFDKTSPEDR